VRIRRIRLLDGLLGWPPFRVSSADGDTTPRRRGAREETFGAQIFVDLRPVDAEARTRDLPVAALLRSRREQTRIPDEGHGNRATIRDADDELVVGAQK